MGEVFALKGKYTYRLNYEKTDSVRYISHLDFVRVLNRTVRRSQLPVTYTIGFNPHPVMVVALPLSVGTTSEDEYIDIDFDEKIDENVVMERFNEAFGGGIRVKRVKCLGDGDLSFKKLNEASYKVIVETKGEVVFDTASFMKLESIVVSKKSKSTIKDVDIKNDIKELKVLNKDGSFIEFFMTLPAGNEYNLKPELVIEAMDKYTEGFEAEFVQSHRLALMADKKSFI